MLLQGVTKEEGGINFAYNFAWSMDLEHCLFFIDALISCIQQAKGIVADLVVYYKDCEDMESLQDKLNAYNGDVFSVFSDLDRPVALVGLAFAQSNTDMPLYLIAEVDSDMCIVRVAIDKDEDEEDIASPDVLLSQAEILAHVAYTCQHCKKGDSNE